MMQRLLTTHTKMYRYQIYLIRYRLCSTASSNNNGNDDWKNDKNLKCLYDGECMLFIN